jgi:hypothetical protein
VFLKLRGESKKSFQRNIGLKKHGEKSYAYFEMDVHSRTVGLGERRRATAVGFTTLGATERV